MNGPLANRLLGAGPHYVKGSYQAKYRRTLQRSIVRGRRRVDFARITRSPKRRWGCVCVVFPVFTSVCAVPFFISYRSRHPISASLEYRRGILSLVHLHRANCDRHCICRVPKTTRSHCFVHSKARMDDADRKFSGEWIDAAGPLGGLLFLRACWNQAPRLRGTRSWRSRILRSSLSRIYCYGHSDEGDRVALNYHEARVDGLRLTEVLLRHVVDRTIRSLKTDVALLPLRQTLIDRPWHHRGCAKLYGVSRSQVFGGTVLLRPPS
jgi:hypothetical protein